MLNCMGLHWGGGGERRVSGHFLATRQALRKASLDKVDPQSTLPAPKRLRALSAVCFSPPGMYPACPGPR